MDVVVFGAGSLGSLVGGLLARAPELSVTLVGRDPHVRAVRESGLRVVGAVEATTAPAATTDGTGLAADITLVTVKAYDTETAAADLATGEHAVVCSLQNGLGNEATLADRLPGATVLAGTATYGARLREPGVVECTGVGELAVGDPEGGPSAAADRLGAALEGAGLAATVAPDMPRRLWEKLAVNAGINGVTALARVGNGRLCEADSPGGDLARRAARETARLARARDVRLSDRDAVEALDSVARATADNDSSTYQDVRAGRRTEVEAIHGHVADGAAAAGIEAPVNRTLADLLRTFELARGLRD